MSFMFNPYPYSDPAAVNPLDVAEMYTKAIIQGNAPAARALLARVKGRQGAVVAVDGYISAPFADLVGAIERECATAGLPIWSVSTDRLYKDSATLARELAAHLPEDREQDPVLLFGSLYEGGYEGLLAPERVATLEKEIAEFKETGTGLMLLHGNGALAPALRHLADVRVFMDVTPMKTTLNVKAGRFRNLGDAEPRPFKSAMRRCYYVDFEVAAHLRGELLRSREMDLYMNGDDPTNMQIMPLESLEAIFDALVSRPLRCKPVYLEGVWGGQYVKKIRRLPDAMKNSAWSFEMIPLEVSVVTQQNDIRTEFPFFTLVQARGDALMGRRCVEKFGGYFPIRFNYDDTWHSSGNMSIQVHPDDKYIVSLHNEKGRQDESYYVVQTGQGAKTYLGFKEDADVEEFVRAARRAEKEGVPVAYDHYVNSIPSNPGAQFLIPAGTIHASGRNQVVLEIGSLTIGSYTYKMYDYLRADLDGNLRPIHIYHGEKVLRRERRTSWVRANLAQSPRVLREGDGWKELVVGEHDLIYFSLRNLIFDRSIEDNTLDRFHVLTLVDGEQVLIRSVADHARCFVQHYLDVVIVPACFGRYEIINQSDGPVVVHKTLLKDGYEND